MMTERKSGQMVPKTKTKSHKRMTPQQRMEYYKSLPLWEVVEKEVEDLVKNKDIQLTTVQDLVVASLLKAVKKYLSDLTLPY